MTPTLDDCPKPTVRVECPVDLLNLPQLVLMDLPPRGAFNEFSDERKLQILWSADIHHRTQLANVHDQLAAAIACIQELQKQPN